MTRATLRAYSFSPCSLTARCMLLGHRRPRQGALAAHPGALAERPAGQTTGRHSRRRVRKLETRYARPARSHGPSPSPTLLRPSCSGCKMLRSRAAAVACCPLHLAPVARRRAAGPVAPPPSRRRHRVRPPRRCTPPPILQSSASFIVLRTTDLSRCLLRRSTFKSHGQAARTWTLGPRGTIGAIEAVTAS